MMPSLPTLSDYREHLVHRLLEQRQELQKDIDAIVMEMAAASRLKSGATLIRIAEATRARLRTAAGIAFAEEKRAIHIPMLDEDEVEQCTVQALTNFSHEIRAQANERFDLLAGRDTAAYKAASQKMPLDQDLARYVKSQRLGFFSEPEPVAMPSVVNNYSVSNAPGAAIQQGSHGSSIKMESHINLQEAAKAVEALDRELSAFEGKSDAVDELKADAAAVKLQLQKKSPAVEVLKQMGISIRNVAEGAVGGALSGPIITAAAAVAAALGG